MEASKNLGIWMDHSVANLIDLKSKKNSHTIKSSFKFIVQVEALYKNERLIYNKAQKIHDAYYDEISDEISNYDHVLLFGPTHAKNELYNYLNKFLHFKEITIDIETSEKMTENEKIDFVKHHFEA